MTVALLAARSAREGRRDPGPAFLLPAMPPLLMVVVFSALFERIAERPGFGGAPYIDYLLPGAAVLTALLGAGFTATSLVQDVAGGYLDRLRLAGVRPAAILAGRQAFEAIRVIPAALVVIAACAALGAPLDGGVPGLAVALALVALLSAAFAGAFMLAGLASGDPQTALALQPLGVLVGLVSTALVPAAVAAEPVGELARINPASRVVEGVRAALQGDVGSGDVAVAAAVGLAGVLVTHLLAGRRLRP